MEIIKEIVKKYPHDVWLQLKMAELDLEFEQIRQDRNRLLFEFSQSRDTISQLRAGIDTG